MKSKIAIIGGGCAGLSFAASIDTSNYEVCLYEKKNRNGSKLLVAGKGGFNLTHSEPLDKIKERYMPSVLFNDSLDYFSNQHYRDYLESEGLKTFIGTSKRIFPEPPTKPIQVVNLLEEKIKSNHVKIINNAKWVGIIIDNDKKILSFEINNVPTKIECDIVIFALGGASWKVTGSAGDWLQKFNKLNIKTSSFQASNCGVMVTWPEEIIRNFSGYPLKNISVTISQQKILGEIMITKYGMEGTPIYAFSKAIRDTLNQKIKLKAHIDFKPQVKQRDLLMKLQKPRSGSWTNHVRTQLNLKAVHMALVKTSSSKQEFHDCNYLADLIKAFPVEIQALAPLDEAISTVGGIALTEISRNFEFTKYANVFAIGEMLDWDAPTGGYLIQGCTSMGKYLANFLNQLT